MHTNNLEQHTASVCCFARLNSLTLEMEAVHFSEMLVNFQQMTECHIPEDGTLHGHYPENFIPHMM
jgi:hypothetical protein